MAPTLSVAAALHFSAHADPAMRNWANCSTPSARVSCGWWGGKFADCRPGAVGLHVQGELYSAVGVDRFPSWPVAVIRAASFGFSFGSALRRTTEIAGECACFLTHRASNKPGFAHPCTKHPITTAKTGLLRVFWPRKTTKGCLGCRLGGFVLFWPESGPFLHARMGCLRLFQRRGGMFGGNIAAELL